MVLGLVSCVHRISIQLHVTTTLSATKPTSSSSWRNRRIVQMWSVPLWGSSGRRGWLCTSQHYWPQNHLKSRARPHIESSISQSDIDVIIHVLRTYEKLSHTTRKFLVHNSQGASGDQSFGAVVQTTGRMLGSESGYNHCFASAVVKRKQRARWTTCEEEHVASRDNP